jgi:hypothetical protein
MKSKKAVYVLVILIAGVWGVILYRIFNFAASPDDNIELQSSFVPPVLNSNAADTFSIFENYPDPFLVKTEPRIESKKINPVPVPKKVVEPLKWPAITYGGMIKSHKSNAQLCMVMISGQSNFMKEGDLVSEIQIKKIYKDSIEVVFQNEKRMVRK